MSPDAIARRCRNGRLVPRYRGVYAVGRPDLTVWGQRRAVVLACGPGAVLSHRSAAGAWGLRPDGGAAWQVAVPTAGRRRPAGPIRTYRHALTAEEITTLEHVPITTVARTLLDLASQVPIHHLRRAVERAVDLGLFHLPDVAAALERHRGRPGSPALASLMTDLRIHGMTHTRSDLEAAFLQLCLDHELPRPIINRGAAGGEIDATWRGHDLIVEIDSWAHHRSPRAFTVDRVKDRAALRAGRRTARFTGDEIERSPANVAAELRALLALATSKVVVI
ncbi:MAG: hypothetical protein QOK49_4740 [Baekduia sp.]|nr:hypothetical protein [Baekduia sp.]